MTWLLTQMWALLGAAALLALVFGWGLRGALLRGRLRRFEVEAGMAQTELEQARTEIEGLYAAQRKLGDGAPEMQAGLEERDQKIAAMGAELSELQSRLNAANETIGGGERGNAAAVAAVVGAMGGAAGSFAQGQLSGAASDDLGDALSQIRDLQGQISALETENTTLQSDLKAALNPPDTAAGDNEAPLDPSGVDTSIEAAPSVEMEKLAWQNDYLRTRLRVFEEKAGVQLSGEPPSGPEDVADETDVDGSSTVVSTPAEDRETPDEELARLRWRNRYLEGRLAYLEEERSRDVTDFEPAVTTEAMMGSVLAPEPAPAPVEEPAPVIETPIEAEAEPEGEPLVEATAEDVTPVQEAVSTAVPERVDAANDLVEPAAAPEAQMPAPTPEDPVELKAVPEPIPTAIVPERPLAADEPSSADERDDLTKIEGVGPRIQNVLNSIGVFSFQQIADWSPSNQAWVDDYLSFSGRVGRQAWVDQAKTLATGSSSPA